ncbi:MAG: hypothetical protein V9E98_12690 [Candidatus Nanopelagicales bacterium]
MPVREDLRHALTDAMRRRDTAVIPPLRSAIAAIDNAEAVTVEAGTEVESPIAGSRGGLGASEAARAELSEPQQIAIVKHEISELASHVERLTRLCRREEADAAKRALTVLGGIVGTTSEA